ncbi:MAG: PepSY domain-containing protein [Burkholderiales bacterium]|nr:PepSY domain-containing protein [Burkholderiales bacterium]
MTKIRKPLAKSLLALSLGVAATTASADDDCNAPVPLWQSREAVMRMAAEQGWQVQRLKIDDGCYELRGKDAQGRDFKAKLDPQTLRLVKMKVRERDRERQPARQPTQGAGAPPHNDVAPAATPSHLTPGTTPRGQIE